MRKVKKQKSEEYCMFYNKFGRYSANLIFSMWNFQDTKTAQILFLRFK